MGNYHGVQGAPLQDVVQRSADPLSHLDPALGSLVDPVVEPVAVRGLGPNPLPEPALRPSLGLPVAHLPQPRVQPDRPAQVPPDDLRRLRGAPQVRREQLDIIRVDGRPQEPPGPLRLHPPQVGQGRVVPTADPPLHVVEGLGVSHYVDVPHGFSSAGRPDKSKVCARDDRATSHARVREPNAVKALNPLSSSGCARTRTQRRSGPQGR